MLECIRQCGYILKTLSNNVVQMLFKILLSEWFYETRKFQTVEFILDSIDLVKSMHNVP